MAEHMAELHSEGRATFAGLVTDGEARPDLPGGAGAGRTGARSAHAGGGTSTATIEARVAGASIVAPRVLAGGQVVDRGAADRR
jgi:hypothetical protein